MMRLARCCWYVLTLRCEEADRIRAVGRAEDLTLSERIGERFHTILCTSCRRARRQLLLLQQMFRDFGDPEEPARHGGPPVPPAQPDHAPAAALDDATRRRIAARLAERAGGDDAAD